MGELGGSLLGGSIGREDSVFPLSTPPNAFSAAFPRKLQFLFRPARYKILYGGRGGTKSWGVARWLLILGKQETIRVLCAREFMNSIKDSVHKLLSDQIVALGLTDHYEILQTSIKGRNGTEFNFEGIKANISKIKSYEGLTHCWVEEANGVSKSSWDVLIPTIRAEGSEIILTFNPELETDETYQRFVLHPPPGAVVQKLTWRDNPWFPDVLRDEMEALKARDMDAYLNVWEGECRQMLDGAVYADELREAQLFQRITRVPYDPTKPVDTFWDLGYHDNTSIWFGQAVGFEYHIIDYYQNRQKGLVHYLNILQGRGYAYGTDWLPHDAKAKQLSAAGRSVEELMRTNGRRVRIVPHLSVADGINAARTIFSTCYFDSERTAEGLQCLRHYRYDVVESPGTTTRQLSRQPIHDWASHGADAFRYLALALKQPKRTQETLLGRAKRRLGGGVDDFGRLKGSEGGVKLGWMR